MLRMKRWNMDDEALDFVKEETTGRSLHVTKPIPKKEALSSARTCGSFQNMALAFHFDRNHLISCHSMPVYRREHLPSGTASNLK